MTTVSTAEILALIASLDWEEFDEVDFETFGGVESEKPMIAYEDNTTYILDGSCLAVYGSYDEEGRVFSDMKTFFLETKTYDICLAQRHRR